MNKMEGAIREFVWWTYVTLVAIGAFLGLLSGLGLFAPTALLLFMLGSIAVFIPWAVLHQDPESLREEDAYRSKRKPRG